MTNSYLLTGKIAGELQLSAHQVERTLALLEEGATVPFIARYRKEATGNLDETAIISIRDRAARLEELEKRRDTVLKTLKEQGNLSPELEKKIREAPSLPVLEDIYLPFRPKRKTRASAAREKGLEPLAEMIVAGGAGGDRGSGRSRSRTPEEAALRFLRTGTEDEPSHRKDPEEAGPTHTADPAAPGSAIAEAGPATVEQALSGARDIVAEWINEDAEVRGNLRKLFDKNAFIISKSIKKKEKEGSKYRDYFDWKEGASKAPSHRILAMFRGAKEGFLSVHVLPDEKAADSVISGTFSRTSRQAGGGGDQASKPTGSDQAVGAEMWDEQFRLSAEDSYKRLLAPSLEKELKTALKKRADEEAIRIFADNLRGLLMAPPLGQKRVLAVDPGLRTGCKIVCLNEQGSLLANETVYPLPPWDRREEAAETLGKLVSNYSIEAVAVGNGTGGREVLAFIEEIDFGRKIAVVPVNESGASVYSASETARREFPNHDVTVRGAVSIGRRLMDPLAELVKIDPKAIGVGQYQHDVDQKLLKKALDETVMSCVNAVGVEVNSASSELLTYVAGLNERTAQNIIEHRKKYGPFPSRRSLLEVDGMGAKIFQQAAGFLRIRDGKNPLDASAVHPERYELVERMTSDLGCTVSSLMENPELRSKIDLAAYVNTSPKHELGMPTLKDILDELSSPGRDPRDRFEAPRFSDQVKTPEDLEEGMVLPGIVTNVTNFGAFVDIGVHQDGLVHISELADRYVKNPADIVRVRQPVTVRVIGVDLERNRIALSMKGI